MVVSRASSGSPSAASALAAEFVHHSRVIPFPNALPVWEAQSLGDCHEGIAEEESPTVKGDSLRIYAMILAGP
jgi:hypothetical protein